ncbi:MAG: hypothetical protein M1819_001800 [Sarea resinae]|nr:MAG: hypothetical protein M1819_001800 [Sarea resinae]
MSPGRSLVEDLTPAEQLRRKHAADEAHRASIEDAIDEEDILHPPPSAGLKSQFPESIPQHPSEPSETLSAKAVGKHKPSEPSTGSQPMREKELNSLNTQSDEMFPSLGGGPQPRAAAPIAAAWGSRKVPSMGNAVVNGATNGYVRELPNSSSPSSRASTPISGALTPGASTTSTLPPSQQHSVRGPTPQAMSLPGRHTERIQFAPSQLLPRGQLKKPVQDVLRDINKRSKATVEMKPGPGGIVIFEGRGPVEAVRQALKDVAGHLGSKQSIKVPIPASVRPHIIGRQGTVVQAISQKTGARIQVPRPDESTLPSDLDDSATIDVSIEGDAVAAEMARREIEAIVNERTSTVNMRLKDIPAEFYPFIAGAHDSRINAMEEGRDLRIRVPYYHTWTNQPPPQVPSPDQVPAFVAHENDPIQLSGDRHAVQEARAEIERQVQDLRRQMTLSQLPINRGQHQFIVGERGSSLHTFLEETGCAVVLPPDSDNTEMITIIGPPDKIESGINRAMDLATSMQGASVDISRQHPNAPVGSQNYARNLTRYLRQRHVVEKLERLYDAHIVLPTSQEGPVAWEVYSRDGKNTIRARSDIINLINGHPPARLTQVDVDPFYHEHLQRNISEQIQQKFGVHMVFPEQSGELPQVLLVYEGPSASASDYELPRTQPSSAEAKQFEVALGQARKQLLDLISDQQVVTKNVDVPKKFHEKFQKFVNREQLNHAADEIPVQVLISHPRNAHSDPRAQHPTSEPMTTESFVLRGLTDSVDAMEKKVIAFVSKEIENERERGYTITFDYPQKFANFLIGKKGETIRKYREEFDVDIQVNDGKVEIKGPKAQAEAAKSRIIALGKKLEDEATHVLRIKPQYHRDLIGPKGSQVNRLQDRYSVRVNFPRSTPIHDDQSTTDATSDAGTGIKTNRPAQGPDEVIIRGPRKGADEARDELLNLLQWTIDHSHMATVSVAQSQIPSLIGQGGREMENMRMSTGAQIDVPGLRDGNTTSGRAEIKLKGTKKQVEDAKKLLEERAKIFDESITRTLSVDKKYHKALIGGGGANIRKIVVDAGGPDDRRELARMVRFPRHESDDNTVRIEGNKAVVEKIVAAIEAIVNERENQVSETVDVAQEKHRLLIGRGGETRRNLESQFNVNIEIPKQSSTGATGLGIRITGQPANVTDAKAHILNMVKDQEGETIIIPRLLHHAVSDNSQIFRRLRNDLKVTVDHAGQQPPPKATSESARSRVKGGALPLITDDDGIVDNYSWEVQDIGDDSGVAGEIPWVLRGSAENVAKARAIIEKALQRVQHQSSTGYLILPDPRTYRLVVGPGGSQINAIRKQTGCKVTVPRDQAKGEAIEIQGSRDGVEEAKDIILSLVNKGENGEAKR